MSSFTKTRHGKTARCANRANSLKSTGPRSSTGKEISSQNRRWHGLAGRFKVLPHENQEAFEHLFDEFVRSEQPVGPVELELVRKMAEYTWLRQRTSRFHESCFYVEEQTPELKVINKPTFASIPSSHKFIRYQAHYDRCYGGASAELLRRKKGNYRTIASNRRNARKPRKCVTKSTRRGSRNGISTKPPRPKPTWSTNNRA